MSIFLRREFCSKTASLLLTIVFLAESTLSPVLSFLPRAASAQTQVAVSLYQVSTAGQISQKLYHVQSSNSFYGIGSDNAIWKWDNSSKQWSRITDGSVKDDFHFISESEIYAIGLDNQIWRWNGIRWNQVSEGGKIQQKIWYVDGNHVYGIGMDNQIWRWGSAGGWVKITSNGQIKDDFHFISENNIYGIGLDNAVWRWDGTDWRSVSAAASTVSATSTSVNLKVNNSDGPLSLSSGATAVVGWNSQGFQFGDSCSASGAPAGSSFSGSSIPVSGSAGVVFANAGTYTLQIVCFRGLRTTAGSFVSSAFDSVIVNVGGIATTSAPGNEIRRKVQFDAPNKIYAINSGNEIWKWNGTVWSAIAPGGKVKDDFTLVNGSENNIYGIGLDNHVWHWNGVIWSRVTMIPGEISQRFHVVSPTLMYGIGLDNKLWKWSDIAGWSPIAPGGQIKDDFHFISESEIYAIGLDNQIWRWNGIRWNQVSEGGKIQQKIWYVDGNHVYGIGMDNQIWRWGSAGGWVKITSNGQIKDDFHFISENNIYGIGLDNAVWRWDGTDWRSVSAAAPPSGVTPSVSHPAPTPTTAPMATLTFEREQERVLPSQPITFSGMLDASRVAFPQGSSLFIAIPEKTSIERIEIDGRALSAGELTLNNGSVKIPFSRALYDGSHPFRIVLQNEVSAVPQLDRNIAVWVSVIGADSKLLLKGRTASTMMAHLPTEVIGKGIVRTVPIMDTPSPCCWVSADTTHFPIREFSFAKTDITRGPFFTPNQTPMLPENIAFTLFPADASMQKIGLSLKQFSDPLAKEFITAEYQYLLGRDPTSDELSRHLPTFTAWRNPYANLMEVYNRRPDVRQLVLVPRDKNIGGSNSGNPLPSWDKLLEWAATKGWQEEQSLVSFKLQAGFDNGWQLFQQLWDARQNAIANGSSGAKKDDFDRIADLCATIKQFWHYYPWVIADQVPDFAKCWANPLRRHNLILWAKDKGWAYNHIVREHYADGEHGGGLMSVSLEPINPSGPILAQMFGPGKYPEFAQDSAIRYPPAQLYYDLISSPEYAQSIQQRFRANIDSIFRLFFSRPASESDIAWTKNKFIGGIASYEFSGDKTFGYDRRWSWINDQWEPNGGLIASNFQYLEDEEFLKNSRFITDDVYGIRHIQGEIDAVSSRLVEMIERTGRQELYSQADNFKRIVSGLYRLYLRRNPTDAEIASKQGKKFGDIEFDLNQSAEYRKNPASDDAIKSLYRNYLGRDPSDADVASWGDKTISTIANSIGSGSDVRAIAQQHPENAYIFPIKYIKMVKCGFFCSIFKLRLTSLTMLIPGYGMLINTAISLGYGISGIVSGPQAAGRITSIVMNSISRGFNEAGFNGKTFVQHVSIARAMAGQAGGVFSITNLFENADSTILDGFRTMAVAPQASGSAFAQAGQTYLGLASLLGAVAGLFGTGQTAPAGRIAQIDVSGHYGSGIAAPSKSTTSAVKSSTATATKDQFMKTLKQGSRGAEVLKLQKLLGEMDLVFLPEHQTGYYGAKTVAAVKRFQKRNGLEQIGFVGAKTRALLNSIIIK